MKVSPACSLPVMRLLPFSSGRDHCNFNLNVPGPATRVLAAAKPIENEEKGCALHQLQAALVGRSEAEKQGVCVGRLGSLMTDGSSLRFPRTLSKGHKILGREWSAQKRI
jgi:hypothetical protein